MVERAFLAMTSYRFITERTNPKNYKIRAPIILKFVANGDMRGIKDYVRWYNLSHKLGLFQEK